MTRILINHQVDRGKKHIGGIMKPAQAKCPEGKLPNLFH
jgi:hypothetical protein